MKLISFDLGLTKTEHSIKNMCISFRNKNMNVSSKVPNHPTHNPRRHLDIVGILRLGHSCYWLLH